jgi:hypothetical protein
MPVIKPKHDGRDVESAIYDGPMPTPGPKVGEVKGIWYAPIKNGDNAGEDQYAVLVKITEGKFKGATLFRYIPMLDSTLFQMNQFLKALCSTQEQVDKLKSWFWDFGMNVSDDEEKMGNPVLGVAKNKAGKVGFNPVGRKIGFVTKIEPYNGEQRAVIDRFVTPLEDEEPESDSDDDSGLGEFDAETTSNPGEPEEDSTPDAPAEDDDDDADDPWS